MKSFLVTTLLLFSTVSFAQVGIGTTTPSASAALELYADNKGFLTPRVQLLGTNDLSTILSPAKGLMVYNLEAFGTGSNAVSSGFYFFDGKKWQRFISQQPDVIIEFNTIDPNVGSPAFSPNFPASTDYLYISAVDGNQWEWNGTSYISYIPPPTTPWYLGGGLNDAAGNKVSTIYRTGRTGFGTESTIDNSAQVDINSTSKGLLPPRMTKTQRDAIVNPATGLLVFCTNCTSSGTGCLAQNVGTPTAPSWECVGATAAPSVSATCNGFVTGTYIDGKAVNGTYTVTFVNNSFTPITVAFATADLVLSGVSGITASAVSPASTTLIAGGTQVVTYTISGTPTTSGTLTGTWSKLTLTCSKTKNITLGDATFPSNVTAFVFSVNDVTLTPNVVFQGTLAIGTTVQMPYTGGSGTYAAYTSPFVQISSEYCEDGASDWTFGYSYSAGTFSGSGNIPVTLITKKAGVITPWLAKRVKTVALINFNCVSAPWSVNGNTYTNTVGVDEGGDAIRGALSQSSCASCAAYDAAPSNTLVTITLNEYNKILTTLSGAALKGYIGNMNTALSAFGIAGGTNNLSPGIIEPLVANSYVVAASHQTYLSVSGHIQLTAAVSPALAVTCLTSVTSPISWTPYVTLYFAVKRPTTHCGVNTYVGHKSGSTSIASCYPAGGSGCRHGTINCGGIASNTQTRTIALQVIATPTKQW